MDNKVYKQHGYKNRTEYLRSMGIEYGVPFDTVCMFANLLGPNEDFDGLINTLEDYESMYGSFI